MRLAHEIQDSELVIASIVNCGQYLAPILELGVSTVFVIYALVSCHQGFLHHAETLLKDQNVVIKDFFVPLTYSLIRHLLDHKDYINACNIAQQSLDFVSKVCPGADINILNSTLLETKWAGPQSKKSQQKKQKQQTGRSEFSFHNSFAVSSEPNFGLGGIRCWQDKFSEYLDMIISSYGVASLMQDGEAKPLYEIALQMFDEQSYNAAAVKFDQKRTLEAVTSIRELYSALNSSGPESVFQQLSAFKKIRGILN